MTTWDLHDLEEIDRCDDLHVAPHRPNGRPGTPTWIWSVTLDGGLYVRAYNGTASSWFRSAQRTGSGLIYAAGQERQVEFVAVGDGEHLRDRLDAAYTAKYGASPYLQPMISNTAAAATVRLDPKTPPTSST